MTDPIADMLTQIRNAQAVRKVDVSIPFSKLKAQIAQILVKEGYIASDTHQEDGGRKAIVLKLKYDDNQPIIHELKRVSTPGRRVYAAGKDIPFVYDGLGISIVSTSKGLMTNRDARRQRIGGEILCEIF